MSGTIRYCLRVSPVTILDHIHVDVFTYIIIYFAVGRRPNQIGRSMRKKTTLTYSSKCTCMYIHFHSHANLNQDFCVKMNVLSIVTQKFLKVLVNCTMASKEVFRPLRNILHRLSLSLSPILSANTIQKIVKKKRNLFDSYKQMKCFGQIFHLYQGS